MTFLRYTDSILRFRGQVLFFFVFGLAFLVWAKNGFLPYYGPWAPSHSSIDYCISVLTGSQMSNNQLIAVSRILTMSFTTYHLQLLQSMICKSCLTYFHAYTFRPALGIKWSLCWHYTCVSKRSSNLMSRVLVSCL